MRKLRRSSSHNSLTRLDQDVETTSSSSSSSSAAIPVDQVENRLKNWDLPRDEIKQIYKTHVFFNWKTQIIKLSNDTYLIGLETETFKVLSQNDIRYLKAKNFRILHIAIVQIAIKPPSLARLEYTNLCLFVRC